MPISVFALQGAQPGKPLDPELAAYLESCGHAMEDVDQLLASPAFDARHPTGTGRITDQISDNVFVVAFDPCEVETTGRAIEIGCRVVWQKPSAAPSPAVAATTAAAPSNAAGVPSAATPAPPEVKEVKAVVAKIHGNGLVAVLEEESGQFHNAVPRNQVRPMRSSATLDHNDALLAIVAWLQKAAGIARRVDAYSAGCILYRRGWRVQDIHLVEPSDIHTPLAFLPRSVRMTILEAAERERDVVRIRREMKKETLMEQDWSYWMSKYSKVWGPVAGAISVLTAALWNYKNYQRGLRPAQVDIAVGRWAHTPPHPPERVPRVAQESRLLRVIQDLDDAHPRVVVVTGNIGTGKSLLVSTVAYELKVPTIQIELRGASKEDLVLSLVKALGVPNLNVCGDLTTFIEDVAKAVRKKTGKMPLLVLKCKDDDVEKAFRDATMLSFDRHITHVVVEVESEKAKRQLLKASRTVFFHVSDFTQQEAVRYVDHRVDPVALEEFLDEIGTNPSDLDWVISMVVNRDVDPLDAIAKRLQRHIADIQTQNRTVKRGLKYLCRAPFDVGVPWVPDAVALSPMVQFDPERKMHVFRTKGQYEAARIVTGVEYAADYSGGGASDGDELAGDAALA